MTLRCQPGLRRRSTRATDRGANERSDDRIVRAAVAAPVAVLGRVDARVLRLVAAIATDGPAIAATRRAVPAGATITVDVAVGRDADVGVIADGPRSGRAAGADAPAAVGIREAAIERAAPREAGREVRARVVRAVRVGRARRRASVGDRGRHLAGSTGRGRGAVLAGTSAPPRGLPEHTRGGGQSVVHIVEPPPPAPPPRPPVNGAPPLQPTTAPSATTIAILVKGFMVTTYGTPTSCTRATVAEVAVAA
ncbi:MAG: hypothetical protein JWM82_3801 [Myxococcales bacterium]|nr:hypothetical protein [Myxococcales bacterium]